MFCFLKQNVLIGKHIFVNIKKFRSRLQNINVTKDECVSIMGF